MSNVYLARSANPVEIFARHQDAMDFLHALSGTYPGIETWFTQKVIPGLSRGTRHIVRVERDDKLVGVGIAKNEDGEQKLCTIRVHPSFQNRGIGIRIIDELLEWLNTEYPLVTVCEEHIGAFNKIFAHYGFVVTSVSMDLYRPGKAEFIFNEPSSPLFSRQILTR